VGVSKILPGTLADYGQSKMLVTDKTENYLIEQFFVVVML
jgi:hypothetical protein